jgi:hypothetical protein
MNDLWNQKIKIIQKQNQIFYSSYVFSVTMMYIHPIFEQKFGHFMCW